MSSISVANNSNRITGMATGMDTDQMVKDMLTSDQAKIDEAEQTQQINEWKQEEYRDVIKKVKGLYDKYFSVSSPDSIIISKNYRTMTTNSSDSSVISAVAGSGATKINYNIKVDSIAEPAQLQSSKMNLTKDAKISDLGLTSTIIKINDVDIDLKDAKNISDVIKIINYKFPKNDVQASFSEMSGKLIIKTKETGLSSKLSLEGELFTALEMKDRDILVGNSGTVQGSNNSIKVFDTDGNKIRTINNEKNTFTIDNITYSVNSVSSKPVSVTSKTDTSSAIEKMDNFINEYNKVINNIYDLITEKKERGYKPLTKAQRDDMSEDEIKKWEDKAKKGILRNDNDMRQFMNSIISSVSGVITGSGFTLKDIGIMSSADYNNQGQLTLDKNKFSEALEKSGEDVFETATEVFSNIKDVTYNYAGSSAGIFINKAGMKNSSTEVNNIYSEQIRKQENHIKELKTKMEKKEDKLYKKFAALEANMSKINAQISYLMGM